MGFFNKLALFCEGFCEGWTSTSAKDVNNIKYYNDHEEEIKFSNDSNSCDPNDPYDPWFEALNSYSQDYYQR